MMIMMSWDVKKCQDIKKILVERKFLLEKTVFGGNLKIWFLIIELTFPVGMDK